MCVLAYSKSRNLSYRLAQCAQRWFHIPLQVPRGAFSFTFPWILVNFYITQYLCVMMQPIFESLTPPQNLKSALNIQKYLHPRKFLTRSILIVFLTIVLLFLTFAISYQTSKLWIHCKYTKKDYQTKWFEI